MAFCRKNIINLARVDDEGSFTVPCTVCGEHHIQSEAGTDRARNIALLLLLLVILTLGFALGTKYFSNNEHTVAKIETTVSKQGTPIVNENRIDSEPVSSQEDEDSSNPQQSISENQNSPVDIETKQPDIENTEIVEKQTSQPTKIKEKSETYPKSKPTKESSSEETSTPTRTVAENVPVLEKGSDDLNIPNTGVTSKSPCKTPQASEVNLPDNYYINTPYSFGFQKNHSSDCGFSYNWNIDNKTYTKETANDIRFNSIGKKNIRLLVNGNRVIDQKILVTYAPQVVKTEYEDIMDKINAGTADANTVKKLRNKFKDANVSKSFVVTNPPKGMPPFSSLDALLGYIASGNQVYGEPVFKKLRFDTEEGNIDQLIIEFN